MLKTAEARTKQRRRSAGFTPLLCAGFSQRADYNPPLQNFRFPNVKDAIGTAKPPSVERPIEKTAEKINVAKEKSPPNPKAAIKAETAPKKDAAKQKQRQKKKVTLDDLIN